MANDTWNFPTWNAMDIGPLGTRQQNGMLWQTGAGTPAPDDVLPYSESITCIGSFFQRQGWSDLDNLQGIFSIGSQGNVKPALQATLNGSTGVDRNLIIQSTDVDSGTTRNHLTVGDEDGINWLQANKWYQYAFSITPSGIKWVINGSQLAKHTVVTAVTGVLNLDFGLERLWLYSITANWPVSDPLGQNVMWPSQIFGPLAISETALDLDDATVRGRIFDSNGDLKNPGENGSLWFGDNYGDDIPHIYCPDGSPRNEKNSGRAWGSQDGGIAGESSPGGLKKQYEFVQPFLPLMMTFDGSTGEYVTLATATSGNLVTMTLSMNRATFSGGGNEYVWRVDGTGGIIRGALIVYSNDHATVELRGKVRFVSKDSGSVTVCDLISDQVLTDSADHTIFASFDGDNGTAIFYVDGIDADDSGFSGRVLITGSLQGGAANGRAAAGSSHGTLWYGGQLGYLGYKDAYLTNPTDFYHPINGIQEVDEVNWTQWNGQPEYWQKHGALVDHRGSEANLTKNGLITGPS